MPIGRYGRVIRGQHPGWFIEVQHDPSSTGGYYILYAENADMYGNGFDDWVLSRDDLERYFTDPDLEVEWLDPQPPED